MENTAIQLPDDPKELKGIVFEQRFKIDDLRSKNDEQVKKISKLEADVPISIDFDRFR